MSTFRRLLSALASRGEMPDPVDDPRYLTAAAYLAPDDPALPRDLTAEQFAAIAAANPDLSGYGRGLSDLYLLPTEES